MRNILVFLSIVILNDCATIPTNQQDQLQSATEPVQDYANMKTTQETINDRIGDQLKRCSDYDIVDSSYQSDAVLALSRREINLLERNRERCEACRRNPLCKDDISRCRTCKRICDRVAEQMATSTTTESTGNEPIEPILGQQQPPFFSDEYYTNFQEPYFTIGSVESGATMNLIAQLFNVDKRDELEQFVILGKLKQGGEIVAKSRSLFIWDIGGVFGLKDNKPIPTEIHSTDNKIDNNKKINLVEELNRELDKAIRKRKEEAGQSKLGRDEIDNLINATMTEILKRRNDTVGCSIEEEFEPIVDLRFKQQPNKNNGIIHKTPISNPPVIQDSFDPKLAANADDIIGEPLMSTETQPLPESDNQINNVRDNYDSSDESSSSSSSSSESDEDTYVGANQPGVPNLSNSMQKAGKPENLHKDITKIVEDGFKMPGIFGQRGENPIAPQSAQNIQEVQKVVEDSLKMSTLNNGENTNVDEKVKNTVEDSLKLSEPTDNFVRQQSPHLPNQLEDKTNNNNSQQPINIQKAIQKIVEDSLKVTEPSDNIIRQQSPNLPIENQLEDKTNNNNSQPPGNTPKAVQNIAEDSLKVTEPTDNSERQQTPHLPIKNNSQPPGNIQEAIQNIVEDSLKVTEPSDNTVRQQSPDLPIENQLEDKTNNNNSQSPGNFQEVIQNIVEDSFTISELADNIVRQQSPDLQLEDNTADKTNTVDSQPARNIQEIIQKTVEEPVINTVEQQGPNLPSRDNTEENAVASPELSIVNLESQKDLKEIQKNINDNLKLAEPTDSIAGQESPNLPNRNKIEEPRLTEISSPSHHAAAQATQTTITTAPYEGTPAEKMPQLFPYDVARPIPNTSEYDAFRQFEGMPAERMSKVFPYHLAQPFTQLPQEPTNEMNPTINKDTTTPISVMDNAVVVGSPISPTNPGISSNTDGKFHSFGSLVPIPGQNADASIRNVYFLGKDIALPLQMYQDANGIMQLSVDMEKLCNCKNKTCIKTHKHLEEFGNSLLKNIENEQDQGEFKKTSDIIKRSPKIDNFPNDNDNYLEFEDKMKKINKVVEKFEEESENLLEESTKVLLRNVEKEGNIEQGVDLINKMLKWMKNVVTEKQN